jgi:hypothetical protein
MAESESGWGMVVEINSVRVQAETINRQPNTSLRLADERIRRSSCPPAYVC